MLLPILFVYGLVFRGYTNDSLCAEKLQAESASWNIARVSVKLRTKCSNRKKFHSILFYTVASRKSKSALEQQYKHFI